MSASTARRKSLAGKRALVTGASSGIGAATAVASGLVPMAHATDSGGSIRVPAGCCGVFGFKPSGGLVASGAEFGPLVGGLNCDHTVSRTVRDSAELPLKTGVLTACVEKGIEVWNERAWRFVPYTETFNVTGQPAMSIPLHQSAGGLPIGMHFAGRVGEDARLLCLARRIEEAAPWIRRRPPSPP